MRISRNTVRGLTLALGVAGVLALSGCPLTQVCSPGDACYANICRQNPAAPGCTPPGGSVRLDWTINQQPAASACATVNAAVVRISIGGGAPIAQPCTSGTFTVPGIAPGSVPVVADLLDGATPPNVLSQFNQPVTVVSNQVAVVTINFTPTGGGGQTGAAAFTWTVNNQPPATACPAGTNVTIESTAGPATPVTGTAACNTGTLTISNIPAGSVTFKATLSTPTPTIVDNITVNIVAGQQANVPVFNFNASGSTGGGSAKVNWTVNGDLSKCPANGSVTVTASGGPTAGNATAACNAGFVTIPNLAAGTYTFDLALTDPDHPGQTATGQAPGVPIVDGQEANVPAVSITCSFCPQ